MDNQITTHQPKQDPRNAAILIYVDGGLQFLHRA